MQVRVDTEHPQAVVTDVTDLERLEVLAPAALPDHELAGRLGDLGRLDGDHVWLWVEELRRSGPADGSWATGFDAMVDYATSKGWVEGGAVRAHVVRT